MTKTNGKPAAAAATPILIVLGYDEHHKPRAARFTGVNPDLVAKAAQAMNLDVRQATSPELVEIAKKLPVGRLYANGKGFVPNVRQALYSKVIVTLAVDAPQGQPTGEPNLPAAQGLPRTWDEIALGHLVIAQETLEYGWWEAIVLERNGDMFTLRFRDYPNVPKFVRHRSAIALMSPPTE